MRTESGILGREPSARLQTRAPIKAREFALEIADLIDERQGHAIAILDVSGPLVIADYFVIATARNRRHAVALAREVSLIGKAAQTTRRGTAGMEGESGWILLDFDEVIVHLFDLETREFYGLENLWSDVPRVAFTAKERPADSGAYPGGSGSFPESGWPDSMGNL